MSKKPMERNKLGLFPFQGQPPYKFPWLRDNKGDVKEWMGMHGGKRGKK